MRDCFYLFHKLTENEEELALDKLREDIEEVENDFDQNRRITLFDNQANFEYDFFNEYEEFEEDTKKAEELFLTVKETDDHSS